MRMIDANLVSQDAALRLGGDTQLFVFRDVRFEGLGGKECVQYLVRKTFIVCQGVNHKRLPSPRCPSTPPRTWHDAAWGIAWSGGSGLSAWLTARWPSCGRSFILSLGIRRFPNHSVNRRAEPEGPNRPELVLAQVTDRDPRLLAASKAGSRPTLGLRCDLCRACVARDCL